MINIKKVENMSPFGQMILPMLNRFLIYFIVSGVSGLLCSFILIKIIPKPKDKFIREELNELIAKVTTVLFIMGGMYLFMETL